MDKHSGDGASTKSSVSSEARTLTSAEKGKKRKGDYYCLKAVLILRLSDSQQQNNTGSSAVLKMYTGFR